ncbi:MAG: FHA domain-containing protein, partial [Crocosphaera sp.]
MPYSTEKSQNIQHILAFNISNSERIFHLDQPQYSIGRYPQNSIVINAEGVSRQHATLIRKDQANNKFSYIIIDGNLDGNKSRNGILVNGSQKSKYELKHGDVIKFTKDVKAHYYIIDKDSENFIHNLSPNNFLPVISSQAKNFASETQIIDRPQGKVTLSKYT